jgi:hypothetical protein
VNRSREFLEALYSGKPGDLYLLLWTLPEKESRWFRDVKDAIRCTDEFRDRDLYVGVGLARQDCGLKRRCPSGEIAGIVGVWADLDLRSDAHPKATLPESIEQALSILPAEFPPSVVVLTGNGAHIWWLFREPWIFESDEERKTAAALVSCWHTLLRDNAGRRGWTYERLADLARVLRVPGTTNRKDPANPKPVTLHSYTDSRFNPSEFTEYLEDLGIQDDETDVAAGGEWAQRFKDTPIIINLSARIPDAVLNEWLEADMRFKKTWLRQRHDLPDQSQTGYDMALCNFGVRKGLPEQQIVDLLIFHRTLHKQRHRTRVEYFQRTLAKVAGTCEHAPSTRDDRNDPQPGGLHESDSASPTGSIRSKALLCRKLCDAIGVEILRIIKVTGSQPFYRMETASGKIEFDTVSKFVSQKSVRMAIAATGKLIRSFKPKAWDEVAQLMLDACVVEEGSEELHQDGAARMHLRHYLAEITFIPSLEGQPAQDLRKAMILNGRITVCANDFVMFINKTTQQNLSVKAGAAMLSAIGASTVRVRSRKIKEQSRWELPLTEFDPADYTRESEGPVDHG